MVQASQEKESNSLLRRVCPPDAGLIPCHVTPAFPTGPALMIIADFCIALSRGMLRLMLEEHRPPASKQKREAEASLSSPIERLTWRSEEHTSELQSLMRISYAVFCLKKKNT